MSLLTQSEHWQQLSQLHEQIQAEHMRDWFKQDPDRAQKMSLSACGIFLDYSKNLVNQEVMSALLGLAQDANLEVKRDAMFSGDKINHTEHRSVLHTALRNFSGAPVYEDGENVMPEIEDCLTKMQRFVHAIHSGDHLGYTGKPIKDVLAIGIGGSFLGPKIMSEALKPYQTGKVNVHFVANVDACHLQDVLAKVSPEETLVIMSSKSFSTQETLQNTLTTREWFYRSGGQKKDVAHHFVAVSSNIEAATDFGIAEDNVFPMWDWVGGRYSMWSAIGLPLALNIGFDNFRALLEGAFDMDQHFRTAPLADNMPVIMALLGIWYRNFFNAQSYVLLPYYHYLRGFPAYVQQLDMESNGKRMAGEQAVDYLTGPIVWGSEGTNGQHSFHQLLHQGTSTIPADFMLPLKVPNQHQVQHAMLASNCFAQSQALMQGKTFDEAYAELVNTSLTDTQKACLAKHKEMLGNKPSNTLLFQQLDPKTLGSLVALYEHKVFVQGIIWQVNSFDQWGVELGKVLGNQILSEINSASVTKSEFDASTAQLIDLFRQSTEE
ncbi:glucose-6-phosphate isomerase [Alteromonas sp. a30]|uniref:glucose-6-phosphate isomerase n=1 Tax=Alteromonas sp. a30 TaxID=2730917 RepID=UPI00227DE5AB|nr:glucose-6-phosphate isomerase [Alteromonas sp. a30]MCY7296138.1 glucose-6-phosphate isomerase [Alteromonas sp. a30]